MIQYIEPSISRYYVLFKQVLKYPNCVFYEVRKKISLFLFCLHRDRRGHLLQSLPKSKNIFHQLRMQFIYKRAVGAERVRGAMEYFPL